MTATRQLLHRDLDEGLIGSYVEISFTDRDDEKIRLAGLVDDFEPVEEDGEDVDTTLFLHSRNDDGSVSCHELSLFEMGLADDLTITLFPDFAVSWSALNQLLRDGSHS